MNLKFYLYYLLAPLRVGLIRSLKNLRSLTLYYADLLLLLKQKKSSPVLFPFAKPYPCLTDRYAESGAANGHYFHQDLLVAQKIFANNPEIHVDIGSRVDGFIAHVASFREIEVFDIRKSKDDIKNIKSREADLMGEISGELSNYCDSISCLHALEHFGLGRYGDPVDFNGFLKGLENIQKILKNKGKCYLSVPIGPQRIEFNAHRVFAVKYLLSLLEDFKIDSFSYVDDHGDLFKNVALSEEAIGNNYGCNYGCGILEMTKTKQA